MFRTLLLRPRMAQLSSPVRFRALQQHRYSSGRPFPHRSSYSPPPPRPSRAVEREPGTLLFWAFALLTIPASLPNLFPTRFLPPVRDPPELQTHSKTPLTALFVLNNPYTALQLLVFRLRRGEYTAFAMNNFAFRPLDYIDDRLPTRVSTWFGYMFAHGGLAHWMFCLIAAQSLIPMLVFRFGATRAAGFFIAAGAGSAGLDCVVSDWRHGKAYRSGTFEEQKSIRVRDSKTGKEKILTFVIPKDSDSLFTYHMGSSGSLMAMLTVVAITMKQSKWSLFLIPVGIPVRVLYSGLVAWDLYGSVFKVKDGIGHEGHLAGCVSGALLYALFLRRVPPVLMR